MNSLPSPTDLCARALIKTEDGVFTAYFSRRGLIRLEFPDRTNSHGNHRPLKNDLPSLRRWTAMVGSALKRALAARVPRPLPPIDLRAGTVFQQSVWRALQRIPPKKTMSYSEVARVIGRPKATRAVGQACGANPIPVIIPCHRVLAAHGRLGGFSAGLDWKRKLLKREGIQFLKTVENID